MSRASDEALWTTDQVATLLSVTPKTVRRWVSERRIPFVKVGGTVRYVPAQIRDWLTANAHEAITPETAQEKLRQWGVVA